MRYLSLMEHSFLTRSKRQIIFSMIFNSVIILMELFALSEVFFRFLPGTKPFLWYLSLTYYTNLSNIALLIGCSFSLLQDARSYQRKKEKLSYHLVKFTSVSIAMVTLVTVYFFVFITANIFLAISVHGNMWLFMHTLCPLFGLLSYLFSDARTALKTRTVLLPIALTILYTLMVECIYLSGGRVPYASDLTSETLPISIIFILLCGLVEIGITFLVSFTNLTLLHLLIRQQKNREEKDLPIKEGR